MNDLVGQVQLELPTKLSELVTSNSRLVKAIVVISFVVSVSDVRSDNQLVQYKDLLCCSLSFLNELRVSGFCGEDWLGVMCISSSLLLLSATKSSRVFVIMFR